MPENKESRNEGSAALTGGACAACRGVEVLELLPVGRLIGFLAEERLAVEPDLAIDVADDEPAFLGILLLLASASLLGVADPCVALSRPGGRTLLGFTRSVAPLVLDILIAASAELFDGATASSNRLSTVKGGASVG
jgi:hypothetical protein